MAVFDRPDTPSRHYAITAEFDQSITTMSIQTRHFVPRIAWYKATDEQKQCYSVDLRIKLGDVLLTDCADECTDLTCTSAIHKSTIDSFCSKIIHACIEADRNIPRTRPPKQNAVAGWIDDVEPIRQTSIFWHKIWIDCGRPVQGAVADVRRLTRRKYHNAVKVCLKNQKSMQRRRLGELASKKGSRPIFDELKKLAGTNSTCTNKIDDLKNDSDICNRFANKYKNTYNMLEDDRIDDLEQCIGARLLQCDSSCCDVSEQEVKAAILKLKADKHDGNGFYSNHLLYGNPVLHGKLAQLFSCMLRHGYTPHALLSAVIVPIPKDRKGDLSDSDNYRGIALGCAISKALDIIILTRHSADVLKTSDMQFAYKPNHSTTMCTMVLKEIIHQYWNGNSSVYGCFVDATKAFDLVSFPKLFELLLDRGLPVPILRVLLDTYKRQRVSAVWNSRKSDSFTVTNGVRQGAVLSATLYTVYVDELMHRLEQKQVGCEIDGMFAGALAYADDVTLLCPTIDGLRSMLKTLEEFGEEYKMKINANKTKCILFTKRKVANMPTLTVAGQEIQWVNSFRHLGATVSADLNDTVDIEQKRNHFIRQANYVNHAFGVSPAWVKSRLIQTYATSLYGSQAWKLDNLALDRMRTAWNIVQRRVWRLPWRAHSVLLPAVSTQSNLLQQIYKRTKTFIRHMEMSKNRLVAKVANLAHLCPSSIIYLNNKFLASITCQIVSEDNKRVAAQIYELNSCLDGESVCGLDPHQIKEILCDISTINI